MIYRLVTTGNVPFFVRYSIHDWNSACLRKVNAAPRFFFVEGNSSRTQPNRMGHFEERVVAPLILIAFFAAQLVQETHVWIYTSHRCSFLHESNYPASGTRYEIENVRRAAGSSRVLYMKIVPTGLVLFI